MEDDNTLHLFADAEIEILPPETLSADPASPHAPVADGPRRPRKTVTAFARSAYRRD
jgi:hypothetical protein